MEQKLLSKGMLLLFTMLMVFPSRGYCAEQTPEEFIKDFYTWYIPTQGMMHAIENNVIYSYVERKTVEEVKKLSKTYIYGRQDYFLKMGDTPHDMSNVNLIVGKATHIGGGIFVAHVAITVMISNKARPCDDIVVILRRIEGALKIFKCVDIYPE